MLNEFLFIKIKEKDIDNIWFQQDGAMCHTAEATLNVLRPVFEDHIISRRADVLWPPRNYDLTSLDYYLWGAVKDKPETIGALKNNIRFISRRADVFWPPRSCGRTIICGVPSMMSVAPTSQRQLKL